MLQSINWGPSIYDELQDKWEKSTAFWMHIFVWAHLIDIGQNVLVNYCLVDSKYIAIIKIEAGYSSEMQEAWEVGFPGWFLKKIMQLRTDLNIIWDEELRIIKRIIRKYLHLKGWDSEWLFSCVSFRTAKLSDSRESFPSADSSHKTDRFLPVSHWQSYHREL